MHVTSEPGAYLHYLDTQAINPRYSASNVMLAMAQNTGLTVGLRHIKNTPDFIAVILPSVLHIGIRHADLHAVLVTVDAAPQAVRPVFRH